jgi:plasmanylethanolamine desaturase
MGEPLKQHDAKKLEAGYIASHRTAEKWGIVVAVAFTLVLAVQVVASPSLSGWWMPLAGLVGILLADFTSGFVHWMFDTWGDLNTPVLGRLAIRTFRHHHVAPTAITEHDFIETNAHNIALTVIYSVVGLLLVRPSAATLFDVFIGQTLLCATFFTAFTSQIHKWAHTAEPPRIVALLQRLRLIISPDHHAVHHVPPYHRNYCITVGWLNGPLRAVRFFETLERTITALTGIVPREDDLGKEAAAEVAEEIAAEVVPPLAPLARPEERERLP